MGDPTAVRVGPGTLYIAPLDSPEPTTLTEEWDEGFVALGYTAEGSEFNFEQTFEDVEVEEELEPVAIVPTKRTASVKFALAEITAENLARAFNGGDVVDGGDIITFEPPAAGEATAVMLGWESDDGLERWVFRKCMQVGSIAMARRKAPDKATLPVEFRLIKPADAKSFVFIQDADFIAD